MPQTSGAARRLVVAIDGPAGAGKSTAARLLAERLGYALVDTGALYRTIALMGRRASASWEDGPALAALARDLDVRFVLDGQTNRVFLRDEEITTSIRTPEISDGASRVSALPEVRAALLDLQRRLGADGGVVVEGRDIGTVVFPQAAAKFFLIADPAERARRRAAELRAAGQRVNVADIEREIAARDQRDSSRAVAPLRKPDDAVEIDSTALGPGEVVDRMAAIVRARAGA